MKKTLFLAGVLTAGALAAQQPTLEFSEAFYVVKENGSAVAPELVLSGPATDTIFYTVSLNAVGNASGTDFTFTSLTDTLLPAATGPVSLPIPILNNATAENDRFFVLEVAIASGATSGDATCTIFIQDDDQVAPTRSKELDLELVTSYLVDANGSAEIVAYDSASQRLFVLNSTATAVEILNFSNPRSISSIATVDMSSQGLGATSVAVHNGLVAATIDAGPTANGKVVFMDTAGTILNTLTVGNLPDMVTFTPNGQYVLTANEGQPESNYTSDPEGSISIIDLSAGVANLTQADVTTATFTAFNSQEAALKSAGVRIFGLNATVAQAVEPEYIVVSPNPQKAWVTLQENNAVAEIDLTTKTITAINALGTKDHSVAANSLDASDRSDSIVMTTYPIRGMYMPDAMGLFTVNGQDYLVTANEGDQREYGVIDEDVAIRDASYVLDPTVFPEGDILKQNHHLGRLAVSPYSGDTDNDGDFDEIHVFGARSFSIWNATTGALIFDSGDDFERVTATDPIYGSLFNASNSNNTFKNRSDNKGPEPEGVAMADINGTPYAFITLERTGGMMVYNVANPAAPVLVDYVNSRDLGPDEGGDLGPEGIIYIGANQSPSDTALVVIANEVSATISVWAVKNVISSIGMEEAQQAQTLQAYPNPTATGLLRLSAPATYVVYNMAGQQVAQGQQTQVVDLTGSPAGAYLLLAEGGQYVRIMLQ